MDRKKILIIWSEETSDFGLPKFYSDSFRELGFDVEELGIFPSYISYSKWIGYKLLQKVFKLEMKNFTDNFLSNNEIKRYLKLNKVEFIIFFRCERITPCFLKELRLLYDIPFINIYSENPFVVQKKAEVHLKTIPYYDLILTFSELYIPVFYQLGAKNVKVLNFAASKDQLINFNSIKKHKLTYFGTWGPIQEYWLKNFDIEVFGSRWNNSSNIKIRKGGIKLEMSKIINKSDMVLNLVRSEHMCLSSMKTFEIPAASSLMICNYTNDQNNFFKDFKHCIYFNSYYEIENKINFIKNRPDLIEKISKEAHKEVAKNHTYLNRCELLLSYLKEF